MHRQRGKTGGVALQCGRGGAAGAVGPGAEAVVALLGQAVGEGGPALGLVLRREAQGEARGGELVVLGHGPVHPLDHFHPQERVDQGVRSGAPRGILDEHVEHLRRGVRVCMCVWQGIHSIHSRFNNPTSYHDCKPRVWPCRGLPKGPWSPYIRSPLTDHSSCPMNHPRCNKTHAACACALPHPTDHPYACLRARGGGGVCVCDTQSFQQYPKRLLSHIASLQQCPHCSNVWLSAPCVLSSLSAQHEDYIQSSCSPYRALQPRLPPVRGACVCGGGRFHHFHQVNQLSLYGHTGVLGASLYGPWLRGFRRASSTVLVQRARHCHVALCVVCVLGLSQLVVVLAAARRPPRPTQFGDFPRKDALDARLPPPASRHAQSGDRSHDLSVARPTLSPVELAGDVCVCVCVCVCALGPGAPHYGCLGPMEVSSITSSTAQRITGGSPTKAQTAVHRDPTHALGHQQWHAVQSG